MSVGAVSQAINFTGKELVLVMGENLDLGGEDSGSKNGVGKSAILNALSYGLYGQAISNIRKDNLINLTNGKNMVVSVEFECNGKSYRIERGRRPNLLRFYENGVAHADDKSNSQGDSRETQQEIERLLGLSHDMFRHIVALNTYVEPFLAMCANDQRAIIEQLLGITMLSEKAETLKNQIKDTKEQIMTDQIRIQATQDANTRIQEQINNLKLRHKLWGEKRAGDIADFSSALSELSEVDIDNELVQHQLLETYDDNKQALKSLDAALTRLSGSLGKEQTAKAQLEKDIETLKSHTCHSCGQKIHDETFDELIKNKTTQLADVQDIIIQIEAAITDHTAKKNAIGPLGKKPEVFYKNITNAYDHKNQLALIAQQLEQRTNETDPYIDQIQEMETTALQEINFNLINELTRLQEHQEFLLKLLTNKDSFIRKKIIDQNLAFLNARLASYLSKIGLPHTVVFQNDLTVSITELGRDLDFHNLSRGEMTRLILSLSWSFRDVWENLYQPINLLFIDELVDLGIDPAGVESTLGILKKMGRDTKRNVWIVSHREELCSRVSEVFKVRKEHGFTTMGVDND